MAGNTPASELKGFEGAMFALHCQVAAQMAPLILSGNLDLPRAIECKMRGVSVPQINVMAKYMDALMKEHMRENMRKSPPESALAEATQDGIRLHVGTGSKHYPLAGFINMQDAASYGIGLVAHTKSLAEYDSMNTRVLGDMQWQADAEVKTMKGSGEIDPRHVLYLNEELLTRRLMAMHEFHNPETVPTISVGTVSRGTKKSINIEIPAPPFMSMAIREPDYLFNILPPQDHDGPPKQGSGPSRG